MKSFLHSMCYIPIETFTLILDFAFSTRNCWVCISLTHFL